MHLTWIQMVSVWILPVLFAVTVHEAAHGYVAYLLGDKTASILGRLTLNPIKHIDIFGTIIVPIVLLLLKFGVIMGWAKPVPVNYNNLYNPKRDMALVALAGPSANFVMAIVWAAIAKIGIVFLTQDFPGALAVCKMGEAGVSINLMLMVLNLLPIPPLDGSHIIASFLPRAMSFGYERIAPYGLLILFGLLYLGVIGAIMIPIIRFFYNFIGMIFGLPF